MLPTTADLTPLLPGLLLVAGGLLSVGVDLFLPRGTNRGPLQWIGTIAAVIAMFVLGGRIGADAVDRGFGGSFVLDDFAAFLGLAICSATILLLAYSGEDIRRRNVSFGEYYGLVLLSAAGMIFLVSSNDFMTLFLNIEILSLAMYVLAGVTRMNPRSNEAAVKYLITGAFASAFLLFGIAFIYGVTGSIAYDGIRAALATGVDSPMLTVGVGLLLVGFAFKVGAAPFHMWVPDVYEGAPTSITAFMSVAVKAAGFGALARVLLVALPHRPDLWANVLWGLSALTMIVGNLMAVQQRSVKRMLAFSSVAHTGYALLALASLQSPMGTFNTAGAGAVLFYMFVYTFGTLGAFTFLVFMGREVQGPGHVEWQDGEQLDDLAGLASRRPWAALAMTVFMVSLAGIPPTAGFMGKFYLFKSAVDQGHYALAIIGVSTSLVSLYYYLRVVVYMYMREGGPADENPDRDAGYVVALSAVATVLLGVVPGWWLDAAARSIQLLK